MEIERIVENFSSAMVDKLNANSGKGGWENTSIHELFCRLLNEVDELGEAIRTGGYSGYMPDEAVDVANFAMMIFDNVMNDRDDTPMIFPNDNLDSLKVQNEQN